MVSKQPKLKTFWMIKFFAGCMVFMLLSMASIAQRLEYGINLFSTSYLGELNNSTTFMTNIRYGGGLHIRKFITPWWTIRGDAYWARIAGSDNLPNPGTTAVLRNLSFRSDILDFDFLTEFHFREIGIRRNDYKMTPYIFGGVNLYRFNPKAEIGGSWVELKPLSTEGQGFLEYPDKTPYALTQIGIPFGFGLRWAMSKKWRFAFEASYRYTFNDYLDDVSGTYVNPAILAANRGNLAVLLADRRQELSNAIPPAGDGDVRGAPRNNDAYVFVGITFSYVVYRKTCPRWR